MTGHDRAPTRLPKLSPTPVPTAGPITLTFHEDVTGISADSAVVRAGYDSRADTTQPAGQPGSWTCTSGAGAQIDCLTGAVRIARWIPSPPLIAGTEYFLDFNPEHVLSLTDLSGNPMDTESLLGFTPAG